MILRLLGYAGRYRNRTRLADFAPIEQVPWAHSQKSLNQLCKTCIDPSVGVLRSVEGETMILGKLTLAMFLLTAPAVWAQFSRADMTQLATDRFDTATKTLNLSPDQVAAIKPLLQSKCVDMGQVKDVYM